MPITYSIKTQCHKNDNIIIEMAKASELILAKNPIIINFYFMSITQNIVDYLTDVLHLTNTINYDMKTCISYPHTRMHVHAHTHTHVHTRAHACTH